MLQDGGSHFHHPVAEEDDVVEKGVRNEGDNVLATPCTRQTSVTIVASRKGTKYQRPKNSPIRPRPAALKCFVMSLSSDLTHAFSSFSALISSALDFFIASSAFSRSATWVVAFSNSA